MLTVQRSHGRVLRSLLHPAVSGNPRSLPFSTSRNSAVANSSGKKLDAAYLQAVGPVAEKLAETGVWKKPSETRVNPKTKKRPKKQLGVVRADKSRVNIVSEKLCDDIVSYFGHSLERHRGCDILEIYPGAGVWSNKLHDYLQPRSHILMEPDAELYRPFLQPLLDKPGTTLIPKSGIIWPELNSILTPEYFPHQAIPDQDSLTRRNDTLLVTANLAFHPKKRFMHFDSLTALVLHQFVDAIRSNTIFQRYGLIRMLVWVRQDDTFNFLPKNVQRRRRQAVDNDLMCEWIHEVCGARIRNGWFLREDALDEYSMAETIKRMEAQNLKMPSGREPPGFLERLAAVRAGKELPAPGTLAPIFNRPYKGLLADLQAADLQNGSLDSTDQRAMSVYKWRLTADTRRSEQCLTTAQELDRIVALCKSRRTSAKKLAEARQAWKSKLSSLSTAFHDQFVTYRDNVHAFRQNPALLGWDRRPYESLVTLPEEFFPNAPCALLDIQPKAPHPLLRSKRSSADRASDVMDVMLHSLMIHPTQQISSALDALSPGAADYIMPKWKSMQDSPSADFVDLRYAEAVPRLMTARHWEEILELWMEWPFHPSISELVGRMQEDSDESYDDPSVDI